MTTTTPRRTPETETVVARRPNQLWVGLAILGAVVLGAVLLWLFVGRNGVSIDDEIADLEQLVAEQEVAQNAQDEAAMLAMLTPDAVLYWDDMPAVVGRQGLRDVYADLWPVFVSIDMTITETSVSDDATMAWMYGTHTMELDLPDAGRVSQLGKWTTISEKIDGEWLVTALNIAPVTPQS